MSQRFQTFGGVDFSGAREPLSNLWSAIGVADEDRLTIVDLRPHAYRADLARFLLDGWKETDAAARAPILWGVDFPLGLPLEVSSALMSEDRWSRQVAWVADRPPNEIRDGAGDAARAGRLCDAGAMAPMDLRLYKQTVEGLRWVHELREEADVAVHPQAPVADAESTLIEVYPTATVRDLGLPKRRTPGRAGASRARGAAFKPYLDFADPRIEALAVTLEDAWDATIACLTAYICRDDLEQPFRIRPDDRARIGREGWIYRSPAALE